MPEADIDDASMLVPALMLMRCSRLTNAEVCPPASSSARRHAQSAGVCLLLVLQHRLGARGQATRSSSRRRRPRGYQGRLRDRSTVPAPGKRAPRTGDLVCRCANPLCLFGCGGRCPPLRLSAVQRELQDGVYGDRYHLFRGQVCLLQRALRRGAGGRVCPVPRTTRRLCIRGADGYVCFRGGTH